jgi:HK97 family phage portal protein
VRWFRRRLAPSDIAVVEVDGIRYDNRAMFRPRSGGGAWQRFAERVRRSYSMLAGGVEDRAINSVPWSRGDALTPTSASQARALQLGAVWSAIRLICDTVSTLPVKSYRKAGETRTPTSLPTLFRQLDDDGTMVPWLWRCVSSLMLRGNAYGLITSRDGMQFPTVIQWLDPDEVSCDDTNPWAPIWYWRGQAVPTQDFVHIPWFVVAGKVQGLSPIEAYAMSVSTGLQAQEYGATWFANGGVPPGTMKNTRQTIDKTQADAISDRLVSAIKRRRPIVYGADWDYNAVSVPPEQAQFLETIQASASQIASIYGLPPEYVGGTSGDSLTYSTVEQNAIRLNQALRPLLVRLENVFSALLPNRQRVKFNADATARADLKTRYEAYEIAQRIGLLTADEMRTMEDLAPLPPGVLPAPQSTPAVGARRYNPGQKRDPDGQFADGVFSVPGDKLRLARRIRLRDGERLAGTAKVAGNRNADHAAVLAAIDGPEGRLVRLGFVRTEDTSRWRAENLGSTVEMNQPTAASVRDGLSDVRAKAQQMVKDYHRDARAEYAKQKAAGEFSAEGFPDWDSYGTDGAISAGEWGDVAWHIEFNERDSMFDEVYVPDVEVAVSVRVKPADAGPDWEFFDDDTFQDHDPASLGRLAKEIDRLSGSATGRKGGRRPRVVIPLKTKWPPDFETATRPAVPATRGVNQ